jgi:diamine N-acetyltransferase
MDFNIRSATGEDCVLIAGIGRVAVELAHRSSCSAEDMNRFLDNTYTPEAIAAELDNPDNCYHLLYYEGKPAGFSKIIMNMAHPNIMEQNITKMDRIYIAEEFYGLRLGYELLQFNIGLSEKNNQAGMWLFTWTGNERAVNFYRRTGFKIVGSHRFKVTETHYNSHHQMLLRY